MARPRVVYKVGGPALEDPALIGPLAEEVRRAQASADVVLVHGGGRQIEKLLKQLEVEARFVDGRRETSPAAMDVVEMVLSGSMNKTLSAGLSTAGLPALGISGRDGNLVRASLVPGLGRVGTPSKIDPSIVEKLWASGFVPVISPVSNGPSGEATNVNADEAAQWIARALGASTLVFLSDVDGVLLDGAAVEKLDEAVIEKRTADGAIHGGMAMKVRMALDAAKSGIPAVVIAGRARLEGRFSGTSISAH
jgi:acetylglutamate kinase